MHRVTYMRISITDRCNERCLYCLPGDQPIEWLPKRHILTYEEILRIARVATGLGISTFRITGGEPLVRRNVAEFIHALHQLPGITDIGLSTNATLLAPQAAALRAAGVTKLNISLDTLDPDRYREISGHGRLADCLAGLEAAQAVGFPQIKLNAVMIRGRNDEQIFDLIEFAATRRLPLRFIELMPVSTSEVLTDDNFISSGEIRRRIATRYPLFPTQTVHGHGPAVYYRAAGLPIDLGFIGAMTNLHFCENCNKVRLTADGKLRPCLGAHLEYDLKPALRDPFSSDDRLRAVFAQTLQNKPEHHEFRNQYVPGRRMVAIGG